MTAGGRNGLARAYQRISAYPGNEGLPTLGVGPVLRAPNGVVQDGREYWNAGKSLYDPGEIGVPTFLVHAEWDAELPSYMLYEYFAKLTNTPCKRYVQIGEGTHFVIMEKNRMQLFQEVQHFLDDGCLASQ